MARGKRKPADEKLAISDQEIAEMIDRRDSIISKIKDLESQKQKILDEQKQEKLAEVAQLLESQGITPEEAIAKLTNESKSTESA